MLPKKLFPVIALLLVLSLTGISCRRGGQPTGEGEVTLTIWSPFDSEESYKELIKEYQKIRKNVKVSYVKKDTEEYELESLNAIAADKGPDVWAIKNDWAVRHADKLVSLPENSLKTDNKDKRTDLEVYKDTFVPAAYEDNVIDNKIYGMPLFADTLNLYLNREVINKKRNQLIRDGADFNDELLSQGPATWDDLIEMVKILTVKSGTEIKQSAVALGTSNNIDIAGDILSALMLQNNTQMVTPDKKSAGFNLSIKKDTGELVFPGTSALEFYTSFASPSKETYTWNSSMPDALDAFVSGQTAMMLGYKYHESLIKQKAPTLDFRVTALPQIKGASEPTDFASYWTLTVPISSKNWQYGWDFVRFAAAQGGSASYLSATGRPTSEKETIEIQMNERVGHNDPWRFQKQTAKTWYKSKFPTKVDGVMADLIDNVVSNGEPPQRAADTAAKLVTDLLKREPY